MLNWYLYISYVSYICIILNETLITLTVKKRRTIQEAADETSIETSGSDLEMTSPLSAPATPPMEEEEDDDFDDESSEFSLYKFSIRNFQSNISHTHLNQRLRQTLLPHDDEGDALVRGPRASYFQFQNILPHTQLLLSFSSRPVWLCGGLFFGSWRTYQSPNLWVHHLKCPATSWTVCLPGRAGGWAAWWDLTR